MVVKFLPWKKMVKVYMLTFYWSGLSFKISMNKLNEEIFALLISQPVKTQAVYYICYLSVF